MQYKKFIEDIWSYYHEHGRVLPWREAATSNHFDPYQILVSEIMLQQTQANRVVPKYQEFLLRFPTVSSLATAPLGAVLTAWQGLGYNRRAKYLWQASKIVMSDYGGVFPASQTELTKLPGVGLNTAGAVCAYAYDQPVVFIETNVRTVFIHYFFPGRDDVRDSELAPHIERALWQANQQGITPREWYWAIMDYGNFLKKAVGNLSRSSKHYAKQTTFEGSRRQVRGKVVRLLAQKPMLGTELQRAITDDRLASVLLDLQQESLITLNGEVYQLA